MQEEWRDIPGFEGSYQASSLGRIKACKRQISRRGRNGLLHVIYRNEKIITPKKRGEYLAVALYSPEGKRMYSIHRLVLETFSGEVGIEVNHKDENKYNNALSNLEWCTKSYNLTYSRGPKLVATGHGKEVAIQGVRAMAKELGISLCSVQRMLRGDYESVKGWEVQYQTPH